MPKPRTKKIKGWMLYEDGEPSQFFWEKDFALIKIENQKTAHRIIWKQELDTKFKIFHCQIIITLPK